MNDLDRVLGRRVPVQETTTTGDIAPVMAGGGLNARPKRADFTKKKKSRPLASVLGESVEEEDHAASQDQEAVIPPDAEELEDGRHDPSGLNLKTPQFAKRGPDSPSGEKEKLLTPRAALVAPDVTPESMTEIDPSDVPGPEVETFRAADVSAPAPAATPTPVPMPEPTGGAAAAALGQRDQFTSTMDTLLGRDRTPAPAIPGGRQEPPPAMESAQPISPEAAAAMFASGGDQLRQGQPMPEPKVGDGKQVAEAFRRFC